MLLPSRQLLLLSLCFISLLVIIHYYINNKEDSKDEVNNKDDKKVDVTNKDDEKVSVLKQHFKFIIPSWEHSKTCAYRDNRSECRQCLTKVNIY